MSACWRDIRLDSDEMICLLSPLIATDTASERNSDEVIVQFTNNPGQAKPNPHPERSEPWAFQFDDGHMCEAVGKLHNGQLNYFCDGPNSPGTHIDRSKPFWTIKTAPTISDANAGIYPNTQRIIAAWFGGNS